MTPIHLRRTKIVATIGPACANPKTMLELVKAGMDVARLNFSHADHETHEKSLKMVRDINKKHNTNIAILQDLQGPKIRIGDLKEPFKIKSGDVITLRSDLTEQTADALPIQYKSIARDVKVGEMVLMDDGNVSGRIVETNGTNRVKIKIEYGEVIKSRKGVNLPETQISEPTLTEKDFRDFEFAIKHNVEWLALSFVRSADDIKLLKELIRLKNGTSKIIAKIEKPEALANIDEIVAAADGIMVARGDLGVEIPMEEVPGWQKRIIKKANSMAKPVILATQVMESMINNPRPTRAEANDVANALVDGADAVMLSGETSVGKYPVMVVSAMDKILRSVEKEDEDIYYRNMEIIPEDADALATSVINTACQLSKETNAKAIIGMTQSGYTAFQLSRCRPKSFIFAFTNNRPILNTLNLLWGVRAFFYNGFVSTDDTIQDVHEILKERDLVQPGDVMVNTASMPLHEHGLTNMIKISRVRNKGEVRE
ncbi:pyruvate kinase [Pontibacter sp. G13]|uniref:pyruvate kinase n=1 Tax=Pontibacter sp. G13 TaxID=3074898 RepID=UPI002889AC64|nr:pyruvate kinase [Pontibacter sp. G13]WNJ21054.1 pyruvate kinase [Pontibacter sp. G13]